MINNGIFAFFKKVEIGIVEIVEKSITLTCVIKLNFIEEPCDKRWLVKKNYFTNIRLNIIFDG